MLSRKGPLRVVKSGDEEDEDEDDTLEIEYKMNQIVGSKDAAATVPPVVGSDPNSSFDSVEDYYNSKARASSGRPWKLEDFR